MKISTILRRACEHAAGNAHHSAVFAIDAVSPSFVAANLALRFYYEYAGPGNFDDDPTARSIMLGLAAAIAESEGL